MRACELVETSPGAGTEVEGVVTEVEGVVTEGGEHWQQPALLPAQAGAPHKRARPSEHLRQVGLVGIAQARAALAEAAKKAQETPRHRAA